MPMLPEPNLCTGCTACAAVCPKDCIAMAADGDGFLHPAVDESRCVGCGLCETVCPVLNKQLPEHTPEAYAVKSRDDASRLASTSGGVFTDLARAILEQGGAVYGAAYDAHFRVVHICAETETELVRLRGAKYAQSDLNGIFRDVKRRLDNGQQVLFSGTPCQVLGLRSYLRRDYNNLLLVDLVCHSVPSPLAWEKYLGHISGGKELAAVNLRCKDTGWSRYGYCNRFDFTDGTCRTDPSGESLYMKLFGGGYITRAACAACPAKGYARISDFTLGDFWEIWDAIPQMDDDKGTSVVLIQSERGRQLWEEISDCLIAMEVSLEEASEKNLAMVRSSSPHLRRKKVLGYIRKGDFSSCKRIINRSNANKRVKCAIRNLISKIIKM